ncbi:hypothetical protein vseg_014489 [Gypsophila vaccaria]
MMMSSGSGRVGGVGPLSSSLSSNLSPLAPPFEVAKSLQKQNSTNTSVNYPDVLMYGPYFDPAGQPWNHSSSATGSKFEATEPMGVNATCSTSPTIYGYSGSQPSTTVSSVYAVASGTAAPYGPFSYDPYPKSMPTAPEEGVKPYYSAYLSPPPQKDGFLSLGVSAGDGFDMQSNSASARMSDCVTSATNHPPQRLWDGDHKLSWGGLWSGVNEQTKWSEYAEGFISKDSNLSDSKVRKRPFIVDGSNKSQSSVDVRTHPFVDRIRDTDISDASNRNNPTQGFGLTSPGSNGCFDVFGGVYRPGSLGIDQRDVVESVINSGGSQKFNGWSRKDHIGQTGVYVFGCTSTASTFPITRNKLTYGESSTSTVGISSVVKPNPEVSAVDKESNICARFDNSYPVELRIPLGSTRQSSIIKRPSSTSVAASSSQIGDPLDSRFGIKKGPKKIQVSPQMTLQFSSNGLDHEVNDAHAAYSIEKLSEGTDAHNPAEDSPCWRGASSSSLSPFTMSEVMGPDVFVNKSDESKSVSMNVPQSKSFPVDTSDSEAYFSKKVEERNSSEGPLVRECVSKGTEDRFPLGFDLNSGDGLRLADESYAFTKDHCVKNKSETGVFSGIQTSETAASERSEKCTPVVANNSPDVPTSSEKHPCSPLGDNAILKHFQEAAKFSDSNIDVNMLLKTLSDLSEMLRCYCFSKRASVPQNYSTSIKHIIANLDASMLMMMGETSSTMPFTEAVSSKKEAIKKINHDNFLGKQDMDQQKLLYKSLWLDAEASLCAMTARARFFRVKADMEKTHDGAEDKEISLSPNTSGDVHGTVRLASQNNHAEVSEFNKCHIPDPQIADVITVEFEGAKATKAETSFLPYSASGQENAGNGSVDSGSTSHAKDVEDSVMARYQILKGRVEYSEAPIQESSKESSSGHKNPSYLNGSGFDSHDRGTTSDSMGDDDPVLDKYQLLKSRVDHGSLNNGYSDLSNSDPLISIYQILQCGDENADSLHEGRDVENFQLLSKSTDDSEEGKASAMARFRIIQGRIQDSNSLDKGHTVGSPGKLVEDDCDEVDFSHKQYQAVMSAFGQHPYFMNYEHVNQSGVLEPMFEQTDLTQLDKTNWLNSTLLESWYGNDRSSSDWEHVSKEDLQKAN